MLQYYVLQGNNLTLFNSKLLYNRVVVKLINVILTNYIEKMSVLNQNFEMVFYLLKVKMKIMFNLKYNQYEHISNNAQRQTD